MSYANLKLLKPSKRYCCNQDIEYIKYRDSKLSPWNYIKNNYIVTTHFVERMHNRHIKIKTIAEILQYGKKYYTIEDDILVVKHVYKNRAIVERNKKLITTIFFGNQDSKKESFIRNLATFTFETE
jgi:hypothetical protein